METFIRIQEPVIARLSLYSKFLEGINRSSLRTVTSAKIAEGTAINPVNVRKDLACFGEFGTRGIGYNVKELHYQILKILNLNQSWPLLLVGAGQLGQALCTYKGFNDRGFLIKFVFDHDPAKIGKRIGKLEVYSMERMPEVICRYSIKIGIIAVPAHAAQEVANLLVNNGLPSILNFAPITLKLPENTEIQNTDLSLNLELITSKLSMHGDSSWRTSCEHIEAELFVETG